MSLQNPDSQPLATDPVSPEKLKQWVQNPAAHYPEIAAAILAQHVVLTTKAGVEDLIGKMRGEVQARAAAQDEAARLTIEKTLLCNTIFYLLKSFEGIAANADKIAEMVQMIGIGEGGKVNKLQLMMNVGKIMDTGGHIMAGFNAEWITKIDLEKLVPLFTDYPIDLDGFARLAGVTYAMLPAGQHLPETPQQ